jgi:DNA-binding NtrC family response regulator
MQVATAGSGKQALEQLSSRSFDLFVTDNVPVPSMNRTALEVLREFRPRTEVLVMSGSTDPSYAFQARQQGAAAYLRKPLKPEKLAAEIRRLYKPAA